MVESEITEHHMQEETDRAQNENGHHDQNNANADHLQHERPAAVGERANQYRRLNNNRMIPYDTALIGTSIMTRLQEVSIGDLMGEEILERNQDRFYLDAQLMRVIAPNNANNSTFIYGSRNTMRGAKNSTQVNYSRLFLLRVHSADNESENGQLFYMMESRNTNTCLWERNVEFRDNGIISVGSIIRIIAPRPIQSKMNGDIPMVQTPWPVIAMKLPLSFPVVHVDKGILGNCSKAFVYNGVQITVIKTEPESTTCSGLFCDKQRLHDWVDARGCGCYHMIQQRSNLAINHSISVYESPENIIKMENFSSTAFSKLYLSSNIPVSTRKSAFNHTDLYFDMLMSIDQVVDYINDHGGFTVVGWYKRGVINDKTLVNGNATNGSSNNNNGEDTKVDKGEINYHVISLRPTNSCLLNRTTNFGQELRNLQYDVSRIPSQL